MNIAVPRLERARPCAPPEGHRWSYIDGNYVLIAAAYGIITSILVSGALGH